MNAINERVSAWAKLCKRWEKTESDRRSSKVSALGQIGAGMCAMELELRAMRAKADTAPDDPLQALNRRLTGARPSA